MTHREEKRREHVVGFLASIDQENPQRLFPIYVWKHLNRLSLTSNASMGAG